MKNLLWSFLEQNPWYGFIGIILSIVGIIATIYFAKKSRKEKDPKYFLRTHNLIRDFSNQLKALEINYAGQTISNLTVTRIFFWNNGMDTIDKVDIAEASPILIKMKNDYKILSAKVLYTKNATNRFSILQHPDESILINFDYLDKNEGGVIQILHTGQSSNDIELLGAIKGCGEPKLYGYQNSFNIPPYFLKIIKRFNSAKNKKIILSIISFIAPFLLLAAELLPNNCSSNLNSVPIWIFTVIIFILYWSFGFYILRRKLPKEFEKYNE